MLDAYFLLVFTNKLSDAYFLLVFASIDMVVTLKRLVKQ